MAYDYNKSTALIIGMTDTDEKVTAASGRISTQEGTALSIWDKSQDREKNANLIGKVTASGHTSTVEHTYFQLAFQNVTAVVEQFIIEFRLASYTVKSRRYVNFSDAGFYVPEFNDEEIEKSYKEHMSKMFALYDELCGNGVLREDARFVLPYCLYSNFFCSVNGREFLNMLTAMICGRGARYPEIKKLGLELYEQAKTRAPGIMASFNKVILVGNMTTDPELKQTTAGISVCSFSIAVNRRFAKTEQGQQNVDFINIVTWRQQAEFVSRYFKKGNPILICGQLHALQMEGIEHITYFIIGILQIKPELQFRRFRIDGNTVCVLITHTGTNHELAEDGQCLDQRRFTGAILSVYAQNI